MSKFSLLTFQIGNVCQYRNKYVDSIIYGMMGLNYCYSTYLQPSMGLWGCISSKSRGRVNDKCVVYILDIWYNMVYHFHCRHGCRREVTWMDVDACMMDHAMRRRYRMAAQDKGKSTDLPASNAGGKFHPPSSVCHHGHAASRRGCCK